MTNEEWLNSLNTEEKAKFLREMVYYGCLYDEWEQQSITENVPTEVIIVKWLKQPHTSQTPQKQDDCPCKVKGCSFETRQACCGCIDYFKWKGRHER